MHRNRMSKKGIRNNLKQGVQFAAGFLKSHAGQIGYYACVALVLTAVAVAAERFRNGQEPEEALILPAMELTTPAPREPEPLFELADNMCMLRKYDDYPAWNGVLCHWETHAATDYACADGKVHSLSDGIIRTIGQSGVYGGFIEVETGEYIVRYASIEASETMMPGLSVEKGDILGETDSSMPGEAHMDAHLHLELVRHGDCLDFAEECGKKAMPVD